MARADHAAVYALGPGGRSADITAQKAHEHSLRASEQLNREILAGLQEGVVVVDMDACVVVANEAAAALFGVSVGELSETAR